MKTLVQGAVISAFAILLIVGAAAPALAQRVEVSGNVGFTNLSSGIDDKRHVNYGVSAGVNFRGGYAALGEYTYLPMGSLSAGGITESGNHQLMGIALRRSFASLLPVSPYVLVAGGYARSTSSISGGWPSGTTTLDGKYVGAGAGVSLRVGKRWGLRPEVRFERQFYTLDTIDNGQNDVRGLLSLYYRFGFIPHP